MKRIILKKCDVRRETFRCSGKGGQNVNKVETGVRFIHEPTGLRAEGRSERSQYQNDAFAWALLQAKLDKMVEGMMDAARSKAYAAKPDASFGQQIRTYRLCGNEQVTTDHRTGVQMPTHRALGKGEIDSFLKAQLA